MTDKTHASLSARVLELLASKICHDLVSPVGAVNNGVEFWTDMGADSAEDAMGLISHSAQQAATRLSTFRLAYGAGGSEKHVSLGDIQKAIEAMVDPKKYTIVWNLNNDELDGILPLGFCKTLLNVVIFIVDVTPKGGQITFNLSASSPVDVEIRIAADMIKLKDSYERILDNMSDVDESELTSYNIHPYLMMSLAAHYNLSLTHQINENDGIFHLFANA